MSSPNLISRTVGRVFLALFAAWNAYALTVVFTDAGAPYGPGESLFHVAAWTWGFLVCMTVTIVMGFVAGFILILAVLWAVDVSDHGDGPPSNFKD
jgi:hypothetical protein